LIRRAEAKTSGKTQFFVGVIALGGLPPRQMPLEKPKISQKFDFRRSATAFVDIFRPITLDTDVARLSENPQGLIKAK
jgi:hypothetical protein